MDGNFDGHDERTGASLFLSERGFLRGTENRRPSGTTNSFESVEEFRGCSLRRASSEAITSTSNGDACTGSNCQKRRRYILKQDVALYGPTPGCEACVALAGGARRVTKPHSGECTHGRAHPA